MGPWLNAVISMSLFGVLTMCMVLSLVILIRKGLKKPFNALLLVIIGVMYLCTAVYCAFALGRAIMSTTFAYDRAGDNTMSYAQARMGSLSEDGQTGRSDWFDSYPTVCVGTSTVIANIVLGDAIVWWRAWVIYKGHRGVQALSILFTLATIAIGVLNMFQTCSPEGYPSVSSASTATSYPEALYQGTTMELVASVVCLASNVIATTLIAYKAWTHRMFVKESFKISLQPSSVERAFVLIAESGLFYCFLWAFLVAFLCMRRSTSPTHLPSGPVVNDLSAHALVYFIEGVFGPVVAIYPTIIIILVALDKSARDPHLISNDSEAPLVRIQSVFLPGEA